MCVRGKQPLSLLVVNILYRVFMTSSSSKEVPRNVTVMLGAISSTEPEPGMCPLRIASEDGTESKDIKLCVR